LFDVLCVNLKKTLNDAKERKGKERKRKEFTFLNAY
jgi:hypothetical protein